MACPPAKLRKLLHSETSRSNYLHYMHLYGGEWAAIRQRDWLTLTFFVLNKHRIRSRWQKSIVFAADLLKCISAFLCRIPCTWSLYLYVLLGVTDRDEKMTTEQKTVFGTAWPRHSREPGREEKEEGERKYVCRNRKKNRTAFIKPKNLYETKTVLNLSFILQEHDIVYEFRMLSGP